MPEDVGYEVLIRCREEYVNMLKNTPHSDEAINENAKLCRSTLNDILRSNNFPVDDVQLIDIKFLLNCIEVYFVPKTDQAN